MPDFQDPLEPIGEVCVPFPEANSNILEEVFDTVSNIADLTSPSVIAGHDVVDDLHEGFFALFPDGAQQTSFSSVLSDHFADPISKVGRVHLLHQFLFDLLDQRFEQQFLNQSILDISLLFFFSSDFLKDFVNSLLQRLSQRLDRTFDSLIDFAASVLKSISQFSNLFDQVLSSSMMIFDANFYFFNRLFEGSLERRHEFTFGLVHKLR